MVVPVQRGLYRLRRSLTECPDVQLRSRRAEFREGGVEKEAAAGGKRNIMQRKFERTDVLPWLASPVGCQRPCLPDSHPGLVSLPCTSRASAAAVGVLALLERASCRLLSCSCVISVSHSVLIGVMA